MECCVVCLFVVFFFFKQKTAYEMRISDWSSDVCSSDLVGGRDAGRVDLRVAGVGEEGAAPVGPPGRRRVGVLGVGRQVEDVAVAAGGIGRASCRESVCQYV